ncbi:hypothetical protein AF2641_03870 [Anoxybacillus flavithermus]|nr:hypothetical protein AF2641_03870 [Anoxybacillus flavithermus]
MDYFRRIIKFFSKLNGNLLRGFYLQRKNISIGDNFKVRGFPHIYNCKGSSITIGNNVTLLSSPVSNAVGINHKTIIRTLFPSAKIVIGSNVGISGATILASSQIIIGDNVNIGANVTILDSDLHPINPYERKKNSINVVKKPVFIEDNVWIGMNSIVLKGVTIGKNSIVGAGSVVTKSIPPNCIAAGNPARVIQKLNYEDKE